MESLLLRNVCLMNDLVNEMVCGNMILKTYGAFLKGSTLYSIINEVLKINFEVVRVQLMNFL
jgi:hypothetical protein